jgi:RimJ/RimL family protein N-acetyltransferase
MSVKIVIETPRLRLREFTQADFPALLAIVSHAEVMRFSDGVESAATARARLDIYRRSYCERGFGKWAVVEKGKGAIIGYCGFGVEDFAGQVEPELGFRLLPAYWGVGLATEAAQACSRHAFSHLKFPRFLGFADPANSASRKVLEKIGMGLIGERPFHGYPVVVYEKKREPVVL